jgi:hypothetical protein
MLQTCAVIGFQGFDGDVSGTDWSYPFCTGLNNLADSLQRKGDNAFARMGRMISHGNS